MFNFILVKFISYNGIALGFSLAYWVSTLLAFYYITKKLKSFDYKELMKSSVKITIASLAMGVCILFLKKRIPEMLIWLMPEISSFILQGEALLLIGIIGALVYVVILKVVKTEEVTIFFSAMKKM
jgi:peptidoglycan biosynthesis protein MviN/MurJ (putative lipid II flippase)